MVCLNLKASCEKHCFKFAFSFVVEAGLWSGCLSENHLGYRQMMIVLQVIVAVIARRKSEAEKE